MDLAERYAHTLMSLFYAGIFCPLIPIIPIIIFFGLGVQYWVDKYLMVKRYSKPES